MTTITDLNQLLKSSTLGWGELFDNLTLETDPLTGGAWAARVRGTKAGVVIFADRVVLPYSALPDGNDAAQAVYDCIKRNVERLAR